MKKAVIIFLSLFVLGCSNKKHSGYFIKDVLHPVVNLNGTWKFTMDPEDSFWALDTFSEKWKDIEVPGECQMQGFAIKHDNPFAYLKRIDIPADFKNKKIIVQFDGVYSYARIWINGNYIRNHSGGFTTWKCDITDYVTPGKTAVLAVEVTDRVDDISYGSGYTLHLIGGILRNVKLMALPKVFPDNIKIVTNFDSNYNNATLSVSGELTSNPSLNSQIKLELTDKNNKKIQLKNPKILFTGNNSFHIKNIVRSPYKWDAEHPNLYKLKVSFYENNKEIYSKIYPFGFREIKILGNKFFINGTESKLRGTCHHDIHPLLGRVSTPEYELLDVMLAKEANINFIRTSHYPPTENFLNLCDKYGIYVEDETAVCFVDTWRRKPYFPGATQNDTLFTGRYLSQLNEIIFSHRNHPSVIIWSIGNENKSGNNFYKSYNRVKNIDTTRPVIFSYPGFAPDSIKLYDILSLHYPPLNGTKNEFGNKVENFSSNKEMPVLCDEWMHSPCYNFRTIKEDPNVRDFWGQSLDTIWKNIYDADGGLGGANWAMIDEIFMLPNTLPGFKEWWGFDSEPALQKFQGPTVGSGEWGMVDVWRRKKPEFWNVKKAYSPFKVLQTEYKNYNNGKNLTVPVYNRFNCTNFNELTIKYNYRNKSYTLNPVNIKPHSKGVLLLPIKTFNTDEVIVLEAFDSQNRLIDRYNLHLKNNNKTAFQNYTEGKTEVLETRDKLIIRCKNNIKIAFDKTTGLIEEVQKPDENYKLSGPFLNLRMEGKEIDFMRKFIDDYGTGWHKKNFKFENRGGKIVIHLKGNTAKLPSVEFDITINFSGKIDVQYTIDGVPSKRIREVGVKFNFDDIVDSVSWKRNAYWSCYPENYLSTPAGKVPLYANIANEYRKKPIKEWAFDTKSFYYNGTQKENIKEELTYISKATKENILTYKLFNGNNTLATVIGSGNESCRLTKNGKVISLFISNQIDYFNIGWGNYQRNIKLDKRFSDRIEIQIIH